jgi:phosphoserine phosphatase
MTAPELQRVLVTVTGPDGPGITATLTEVIAEVGVSLLDVEQVVVQDRLTLCLLLGVDARPEKNQGAIKDLLFAAKNLGLDLQFRVLEPSEGRTRPGLRRYAITVIGDGLDARCLHTVTTALAQHETNIESIRRLSDDELTSVEFIVAMTPSEQRESSLRRSLLEATAPLEIDVALQRETLTRRSKRLVAMDMDSTLIQMEVIDELARIHGVADRVEQITRTAMAGGMPFELSLAERVAMLEGLSYERVMTVARHLPLTDGAREMLHVLRTLGYKTAVISGGFTFAANALKDQLGLDYAYANQLDVQDGKLTGRVLEPIVGPQRKADLLDTIAQREGIALEQTIAIGDGANDLLMLERAGLGIAFHAKPKLRASADTALRAGGLDRILYLLGLHAREVNELLQRIPLPVP